MPAFRRAQTLNLNSSTKKSAAIVWFRRDLRLRDNPALRAAVEHGGPVVPVFIFAPEEESPWQPGAASRWWLHHSLVALDSDLRRLGSRLLIRRGASLECLRRLIQETGANAAFWNRLYEPASIARDQVAEAALLADGLEVKSFNAALLHEPGTVKNRSGQPFQVFTPFWRYCLSCEPPPALRPAPRALAPPSPWPASLQVEQLGLEPQLPWAAELQAMWRPGEAEATRTLQGFLSQNFDDYSESRNRPSVAGTSRLSPHLHFGEIGPREIWHALEQRATKGGGSPETWRNSQFLAELGWREFAHHLLWHFPRTAGEPLRAEFKDFPWRNDPVALKAWQKGRTGYPIVDSGMRELWTTGWMHNRVRMIVASFLVKDLLLSWQEGARWFWDTLVDADLANNTLNWQWVAGCGADAAPFFRIFNPALQGRKFDPQGAYIRRWCPELAELPEAFLHEPSSAPALALRSHHLEPGRSYPRPIVSHNIARQVALEAFARTKRQSKA